MCEEFLHRMEEKERRQEGRGGGKEEEKKERPGQARPGKARQGLQDGSAGEDACFQVWLIVFIPRTH